MRFVYHSTGMAQLQRLTIATSQWNDRQILLTEAQQHYLYRVLRLKAPDQFIAMDGQGQGWLVMLQTDRTAQVLEPIALQTELPVALTLLMALPKTGMDDVVRQATELGVQRIVPILSQRSLLNPSSQKLDRWQRIAQEAAEQSERQFVPELLPPQSWSVALESWNGAIGSCFFCEARGEHPHLLSTLVTKSAESCQQASVWVVAIGPEGGWTDQEQQQALAAGYQVVSLGARVLRAVTAPLMALSLMAAALEMR